MSGRKKNSWIWWVIIFIALSNMGLLEGLFGLFAGAIGIGVFGIALFAIIKAIKALSGSGKNQNRYYNPNQAYNPDQRYNPNQTYNPNRTYNPNQTYNQAGQPGQAGQAGYGGQAGQPGQPGQNYQTYNGAVDTRAGSGSANPYSSTYRYSYNGRQNDQNVQTVKVRPADEPVKLSRREKRKLQKQAAMEAELAKARAAEQAKIDAEKKAEEQRKLREQMKQEQEQSLIDKYKVNKRPRTGDNAIDKMLDEEEKAIAEMRRLDDAIEDEKVSAQIVHLEDVTTKIVDYVIQHPSKKNAVRRFFNYYLPTAVKLLNSYDHMDDAGISGANIDGTKEQVEEMMDKALEAFDKQLDSLYADEAMDVSSEIKVMENLLAQEGLTDEMNITQLKL